MKQEKSKSESDVLNERVDKANREYKIADNEYSGTKSDAKVCIQLKSASF